MGGDKIRVRISGVINWYFAGDFLRGLYDNLGFEKTRQDHLTRIADAKVKGRMRGEWYEINVEFDEEREQHLGVYTEHECHFEILIKTTSRNGHRLGEILSKIPVLKGGYWNSEEYIS